ncbi:tRNA-dihydrouridine synthase B [Campylobacter iguaniorum]|uniref:tRNA-dihydrouridine synthase n=1 Tax=Campylobacter iguaniorum TaxID=1244531 RepID=A0A076F9E3_9BACT|nr:tRNA-dihydrouridine synthase [Campylobacter iguaniorum]AII14132.1 tRNA-dihydrouridine synthase B [Campylobacter iguaniorum]ALV23871.1 tRNA-dihydrouridine synthase B [Campylobacter iguaniorum]ANE35299.1 tRNA-dihydrouridine synthase B [Campylobacter iguaniorum]
MIDFNSKPLFLAPLAGFSDLPLRGVVKKFGCDVTVSEMISSNALVYESAKTLTMIEKNALETPYIVQLAGSDKDIIKKAVEILNNIDGIDGIDLNCGCPVPKVIKQNAGSALLNDSNLLCDIVETIKNISNKRYTSVKIRLGFSEKNAYKIVKDIENAGADYLAVHGRTRAGGYSSKVDYEAIARIKQNVKIPVIANGDIDKDNIDEVLKITNCDGAMIGRASIGKPWIFYEIKNKRTISDELKKEIIIEHFRQMIAHYKEHGVAVFRKHLHEYSKGINGASAFRNEINLITDPNLMLSKVKDFFR